MPWYKSFWKVIAVLVLAIMLLVAVAFALLVFQEVRNLNTGEVSQFASNNYVNDNGAIGFVPGIGDDPYIGDPEAPVQIIAFEDFQCPFCFQAAPIMKSILQRYPNDVLYVFKDFPLKEIHAQAYPAALAAECAGEQDKFWVYHDLLYSNQDEFSDPDAFLVLAEQAELDEDKFKACLTEERYAEAVQQDINEGILGSVKSTPTYFVNGVKLEGLLSEETWIEIIETARSQ